MGPIAPDPLEDIALGVMEAIGGDAAVHPLQGAAVSLDEPVAEENDSSRSSSIASEASALFLEQGYPGVVVFRSVGHGATIFLRSSAERQ